MRLQPPQSRPPLSPSQRLPTPFELIPAFDRSCHYTTLVSLSLVSLLALAGFAGFRFNCVGRFRYRFWNPFRFRRVIGRSVSFFTLLSSRWIACALSSDAAAHCFTGTLFPIVDSTAGCEGRKASLRTPRQNQNRAKMHSCIHADFSGSSDKKHDQRRNWSPTDSIQQSLK